MSRTYQLGHLDGFTISPEFPPSEREAFFQWFTEHHVLDTGTGKWRQREVVEAAKEFRQVDTDSVRALPPCESELPHEPWWKRLTGGRP